MTGLENPWPRLPKWLKKFARILSHKHDEMSSFCLNNGFRLQKIKTRQKQKQNKQPGPPPDAGNSLRKSPFIMCHIRFENEIAR